MNHRFSKVLKLYDQIMICLWLSLAHVLAVELLWFELLRKCSKYEGCALSAALYKAQHTSPNITCKLGNICPVRLTVHLTVPNTCWNCTTLCKFLIACHHLALVEQLKGRASLGFSVGCWEELCKCGLQQFRNLHKSPSRLAYSILWKPTGAMVSFVTKSANAGTLELWLWK